MKKKSRAERHAEVIEEAIREARKVAMSDGAIELAKRSHGRYGVWTDADEKRLRDGIVLIPSNGPRPMVYELQSAKKAKSFVGSEEEQEDEEETES